MCSKETNMEECSATNGSGETLNKHHGVSRMDWPDRPKIGLLLNFQQPHLEQQFIASAHQVWMKVDAMTYIAVIFPSIAKIVSFSSPGIVPMLMHHFFVLVFGMGIPLGMCKTMWTYPSWYLRMRGTFMPWMKLFIAAGQAVVVSTQDALDLWVPNRRGFMLRGLARTTVPPSIAVALTLPLPFKQHIFLQAIMAMASLAWLPKLIHSCESHENLRVSMSAVGHRTEEVLKQMSLFGWPLESTIYPKEYPCWMVGLFYSIMLEFFTPLLIVYVLENAFRVNYLQTKVCFIDSTETRLLKAGCALMAIVFFIVSCQFVWFSMR